MQQGEHLGRYRVLRRVGTGASSTVFAATDAAGTWVAIKVLHAELTGEPELVLRLLNEERAARHFDHPGVVRVYEGGWLPMGRPFVVMEYLEGTLADRLRAGALALDEALSIAHQAALALAALHGQGVVHRDVKPANLMFVPGSKGLVKVVDLGLAKLTGLRAQAADVLPVSTAEADLVGTREYRAPEQWTNAKVVDGRADVYSLGIVLYEALCGRCPFTAERDRVLMEEHLFRAPPALPDAPSEVSGLLARMLTKKRAERPTMDRVAAEIALLRKK